MPLPKRATFITLATLSSLGVLAGGAFAAGAVSVNQSNLTFSVPSLSVSRGTVVTFNNGDTVSHNILVKGNGVNLNSGLQKPGTPFRAPFFKPGSYDVTCGIHPKMKMTVKVN